jgi:hypothetical protein
MNASEAFIAPSISGHSSGVNANPVSSRKMRTLRSRYQGFANP